HGRGDPVTRLRTVFHHEAAGKGHRPRSVDRVRDRQAERRACMDRQQGGRRDSRDDLFRRRASNESGRMTPAALRQALNAVPTLTPAPLPTPVAPMSRLSGLLGGGPNLLVKRDDTIGFAFGGNKVRKLALLGAQARADGIDTLITAGGLQSNHARVTA